MTKSILLLLIAGFTSVLTLGSQAAYPEKPIRIIVPYAAGGGADTTARLLGAKLTGSLGQPVIVDNRPGGNAVIGTSAIAQAAPDGYTIGLVISAHAINSFVLKNVPYDASRDFEPIAYVARMPGVLVVSPSFQVQTVPELVALARREPKKYFYAVAGGLTNGHVSMEMLKIATGIDVTPVVFKGGAPASVEVASGRIQMMIVAPPAALPFIQAGKLRAIATTGATRSRRFESTPTLIESGYPDLETYEWFGILAPSGLPRQIVDKLASAISLALRDEKINETLSDAGLEVVNGGPEQLRVFMEKEMNKMSDLSRKVNLDTQ